MPLLPTHPSAAISVSVSPSPATRRLASVHCALEQAEAAGDIALRRVDATAAQVAALLVACMDGIKHTQGGGEALRQGIALQIRVLGAALLRM